MSSPTNTLTSGSAMGKLLKTHALAFSDISAVRVAVDQELTGFDASLAGVREVAFFPPMTGG